VSKGHIRWGRIIVVIALLGGIAYGGWWLAQTWGARSSAAAAPPTAAQIPANARAPDGVRIKVEILNATAIKGLARRATAFLRDRGFDVVGTGTVHEQRDSTLVLDRSGHPDWARLVARALNARVESRPDSARYLDITVLLGGNWRPPALPFYP
jgi:LytR cell envelope-related transcriptional attenuator